MYIVYRIKLLKWKKKICLWNQDSSEEKTVHQSYMTLNSYKTIVQFDRLI